MQAMTTFLLRLPQSLMDEVAALSEECHTSKSAFIRQACSRQIDIIRTVELPAIREHYRNRIPNLH